MEAVETQERAAGDCRGGIAFRAVPLSEAERSGLNIREGETEKGEGS